MTRYIFGILGILLINTFAYSQSKIFGYINGNEGKPLKGVEVKLLPSGKVTETDQVGYFQFSNIENGKYTIVFNATYYQQLEKEVTVSGEKKIEIEKITLIYEPEDSEVGIITLTASELNDDENDGIQTGVGLLQASRDEFSRTAAFEWGTYWFRPRGFDNRYNDVQFNGVQMAKQDNGRVEFSNWGGLNDVVRYPTEIAQNNNTSVNTFGNLAGVTYYSTRASDYSKGTSISYSLTNRSYRNRIMATYASGMNKNGWAYVISGSRRWAEEGYFEGTFQDRYAYFASIEKKINDKHSLNLTAFGTPGKSAGNSPNTQEVWDLKGKQYNAYWGWQDGEKRNERVRKTFEPIFQLTHFWNINDNSKLKTTASYQTGRDARSRLDWYKANNPSPTYYKNLPSSVYLYDVNLVELNRKLDAFTNDSDYYQIDWNSLYNQNRNRISSDLGAAYKLVEDVNEDDTFNFATHFTTKLNDVKINANVNYQNLKSDNFREIKDLLGADFALNIDNYANVGSGEYDVDNPNQKVHEGDKTQYHYILNRDQFYANFSAEKDINQFNVILSTFGSYTNSVRDGQFRHYLFLDNSKGKSENYDSFNYGIKTSTTYKVDGRNFIKLNAGYFTLAPTLNEIFLNARNNNMITPNLKSQKIFSSDLSYVLRSPKVRARATAYYTTINDATEISRYYVQGIGIDGNDANYFITEALSGINKKHIGAELAVNYKITSAFEATAVASIGQFTYDNNPELYLVANDISNVVKFDNTYIKNYKVTGTPQKAYSLALKYNSPKYWWAGISGNYLADNYLDFSAIPRTNNLTDTPYAGMNEETVRYVLQQQKFDDQFMLNATAGKSFKFGDYRLGFIVSVNNILNNKNYITGGYEQGRFSDFNELLTDVERGKNRVFGSKLWYGMGTSYFFNVYLRF
ncbi:MAG: carboxypeptidase-like regulatory domain-containing protein [Flavobacteriales bacterium]|nr:carboxypeptidase-like regulatory domain-containing protein [Flavobacteriales bacterium]